MAGSVNKVILVGNLGRDPEVRHTQDGKPIVNLREPQSHEPVSGASDVEGTLHGQPGSAHPVEQREDHHSAPGPAGRECI